MTEGEAEPSETEAEVDRAAENRPDEAQTKLPCASSDETAIEPSVGEAHGLHTKPIPERFRISWSGVGPILSVIGALAGVALGGYISYANNNATIAAEREQTVEQFRRDNRHDVYATILKQATNLRNASDFSSSAFGALGTVSLGAGQAADAIAGAVGSQTVSTPPAGPPNWGTNAENGFVGGIKFDHNLGVVRKDWQSAYTALDQAISDAEIASSNKVINLARALRDKYRDDYYQSVVTQLSALPKAQETSFDVAKLAAALVGVPQATTQSYDPALLSKSTDELMGMFVQAAKEDLGLNDR